MRLLWQVSVSVLVGVNFSSSLTNAQLVGCDAVDCPPDLQNPSVSSCDLGGVNYYSLGIANFTSALSPSPFTWTLGASQTDAPANSSGELWTRGFYLGAPPTVNMSDLTTTTGCALFFEGVSSSLQFPAANLDTSIGTCSDALNSACVEDLLAQATSTLLELSKSSSNICEALKDSLQNNAPKSCSAVQQGNWGGMTAKSKCARFRMLDRLLTMSFQILLAALPRCPYHWQLVIQPQGLTIQYHMSRATTSRPSQSTRS